MCAFRAAPHTSNKLHYHITHYIPEILLRIPSLNNKTNTRFYSTRPATIRFMAISWAWVAALRGRSTLALTCTGTEEDNERDPPFTYSRRRRSPRKSINYTMYTIIIISISSPVRRSCSPTKRDCEFCGMLENQGWRRKSRKQQERIRFPPAALRHLDANICIGPSGSLPRHSSCTRRVSPMTVPFRPKDSSQVTPPSFRSCFVISHTSSACLGRCHSDTPTRNTRKYFLNSFVAL